MGDDLEKEHRTAGQKHSLQMCCVDKSNAC